MKRSKHVKLHRFRQIRHLQQLLDKCNGLVVVVVVVVLRNFNNESSKFNLSLLEEWQVVCHATHAAAAATTRTSKSSLFTVKNDQTNVDGTPPGAFAVVVIVCDRQRPLDRIDVSS